MLKALILAVVILFIWERIKATFLKYQEPKGGRIIARWLTLYLVGAYALIILLSIIEFLVKNPQANIYLSLSGLIFLFTGRFLRNSSMRLLKERSFWSIHTKIFPQQKLVKEGPFAYLSHPYYCGTMLELSGFCLFLNAYLALILSFVIFIPVLIVRMIIESRALAKFT